MYRISREKIEEYASVAKLSFTEEEYDQLVEIFHKYEGIGERLNSLDLSDVEPTYYGNDLHDVYREDVAVDSGKKEALLNNAPTAQDGYIQVPAIMESEEV